MVDIASCQSSSADLTTFPMFPCSWKISRAINKVPFDVCHVAWCTEVWPGLFLSGRTILRADPDLKIGPKLKIVNNTVTSIKGK